MTKTPRTKAAKAEAEPKARRATKAAALIALMRTEGGVTAQALAEAVGWQVHSVRGFIAGNLKKRSDLQVVTSRTDGATRYSVVNVAAEGGEA